MPRKPKPPPDDPEQFKRFIDMAHKVGAKNDPERFDRVLEKVAQSSKSRPDRSGNAPGSNRNRDRSRRVDRREPSPNDR